MGVPRQPQCMLNVGRSQEVKAARFDRAIRRFNSCRLSIVHCNTKCIGLKAQSLKASLPNAARLNEGVAFVC